MVPLTFRRGHWLLTDSQGSINCNARYESLVMEQAKALNPNIKLYAFGGWGIAYDIAKKSDTGVEAARGRAPPEWYPAEGAHRIGR